MRSASPRKNGSASKHVPSIRIYLRQSLDELKQKSTGTQHNLVRTAIAQLSTREPAVAGMPVVTYTDINCARDDYMRPDFLRFMAEVGKGDISFVAWRDRLGEGTGYPWFLDTIVNIRKSRLIVADPFEEIIWNGTTGLIESIHGSQFAAYRAAIKVKVTSNLRDKLARGYAAGSVGIGFRTEADPTTGKFVGGVFRPEKKIMLNEKEVADILRMAELRCAPMGWIKIAHQLRAEGIRSRKGPFTSTTIRQTLLNRRNICEWSMGKRKMLKTSGRKIMVDGDNPTFIRVPEHLRIMSQELWERVQAVGNERRRGDRMNEGRPVHPLTGVLRCNGCGGALSVFYGRGVRRYSCSRRRTGGDCITRGTIVADLIEARTLDAAARTIDACAAAVKAACRAEAARQTTARRPAPSEVDRELVAARERLRKARKFAYDSEDYSEETAERIKRLADGVKQLEQDQAAAVVVTETAEEIERATLATLRGMKRALAGEPLEARDALMLMFPHGIELEVTPGSYNVKAGTSLGITPRLLPSGCNRGVIPLKLSIPRRAA